MPLQGPSKRAACMGEASRSVLHPVVVSSTSMLPRELSVCRYRVTGGTLVLGIVTYIFWHVYDRAISEQGDNQGGGVGR